MYDVNHASPAIEKANAHTAITIRYASTRCLRFFLGLLLITTTIATISCKASAEPLSRAAAALLFEVSRNRYHSISHAALLSAV
jgi:hypothetical protein